MPSVSAKVAEPAGGAGADFGGAVFGADWTALVLGSFLQDKKSRQQRVIGRTILIIEKWNGTAAKLP